MSVFPVKRIITLARCLKRPDSTNRHLLPSLKDGLEYWPAMKLSALMLFLACCFTDLVRCANETSSSSSFYAVDKPIQILASIRKFGYEVHLCSATFLLPRVLITTARCIVNEEEENTFVHYGTERFGGAGALVPIYKLSPHPDYEPDTNEKNVGLVFTREMSLPLDLLKMPRFWSSMKGEATTYQWSFTTPEQTAFAMLPKKVKLLTNAKCSMFLEEFVPCNLICAESEDVRHGSWDQGIALAAGVGDYFHVIAVYNRPYKNRHTSIDKYELIAPYTSWITDQVGMYGAMVNATMPMS